MKSNLFIIGAPKCGTTSLANSLSKSSDCFLPNIKEPDFWGHNKINDVLINKYQSIYRKGINKKYLVDASASYFSNHKAISQIYRYNPKALIIIMLRDPIERAFSHWKMEKYQYLRESYDFKTAFYLNGNHFNYFNQKINPYREVSKYKTHIGVVYDIFSKSQVLITSIKDPNLLQKTSDFLNIKITHIEKLNSSYSSINPTLQKLINSDHLDIFRKLIPIDKRDKLKNFFYKKNKPILLKDFLSNSEIMEMKKYFSQEYEFLKKHQVHL